MGRRTLLGLTKSKVDLRGRLLYVARSYDRDTNKSQREEVIPIATELLPFLRLAMDASSSELVFPRPDGTMMREDVDIENVLRRALARAGIVLGYDHVCRRKGCGFSVPADDAELRRCSKCNMKLWPKAKVRPIRFHDLRHTTASLLLMAGANPAAVQRILRHSDPRITTEVYGHLVPDYLRAEIDRLSFGISPTPTPRRQRPSVRWIWARFPAGLLHLCYSRPGPGRKPRISTPTPPTISRLCKCGRGETRTHYPRLRRPVLYPDELRAQVSSFFSAAAGGSARRQRRAGRMARPSRAGERAAVSSSASAWTRRSCWRVWTAWRRAMAFSTTSRRFRAAM